MNEGDERSIASSPQDEVAAVTSSAPTALGWSLPEAAGGERALSALLQDFYDRLYLDPMVGFLFEPHDKATLIAHQYSYVCAYLGDRAGDYQGRSMRRAHEALPLLGAHFDRRHVILRQVMDAHQLPTHVAQAWLELEQRLRPFIVRQGAAARARIVAGGSA